MSTTTLPCIPSVRKQQLHLEFISLRHAAPPGVYVSLAPGDPTLWTGVIFVRSGPYASAILRFQVRFPDVYPDLPPSVTFNTDIFHPLIVPLTTYTFSTNSASDNPVSATDDERLPPGGFSLRHGFPHWFGRAKRNDLASAASSRKVSGTNTVVNEGETTAKDPMAPDEEPEVTTTLDIPSDTIDDQDIQEGEENTETRISSMPSMNHFDELRTVVPVAELLDYIRSTFDDEAVLDSLPVEAAANPGAWHAWRAHRRDGIAPSTLRRDSPQTRLPGDWHWDGIWIRFSQLDDTTVSSVKENMANLVAALLISLILIPIVILVCAVAVALACSEFWSTRSHKVWLFHCCRRQRRQRKKVSRSDIESSTASEGTETPAAALE
ncbi:Ubiquitin-conjugating enzyme [Penicillium taxi]|uniref:Ubiquitin-conjugating enzyme n=1 Tax=Penicillium taxi TaxID=168475 RepID=UPI002544EE24|nr:Ubiquitin-conjugating enzyme [Penicillium taxi]KAJ5901625.1 Ubiquitin-conjugating enzyme [Penicillium taxi]